MARRTIDFEWHVGESNSWAIPSCIDEPMETPSFAHAISGDRQFLLEMLRGLLVLLAGIVLTAASSFSPQEIRYNHIYSELEVLLLLEEQAWQQRNGAVLKKGWDADVDDYWLKEWSDLGSMDDPQPSAAPGDIRLHLQSVNLVDEFVVADVLIERPVTQWWQLTPYREMRFYRPSTEGWLRTAPPSIYWGNPEAVETTHLRFEYYTRDAAIVAKVSTELEDAYVRLFSMTRGELPETQSKLTFVLVPDLITKWDAPGHRIEITSPTLEKIPHTLSIADHLFDTVVKRMTYHVVNQTFPPTRYHWDIVTVGLRNWLWLDLLDRPSPWHIQAEATFYKHLAQRLPLRLADITDTRNMSGSQRELFLWQYISAQSFVAYAVEEKGRDAVPTLVLAFARYRSWADLVSELFGQSIKEVETGWNQYLERKIGE